MTNEEKAKEIAEKTIDDASTSFLGWINEMSTDFCEWSALEMAEWKDKQLKEIVQKAWELFQQHATYMHPRKGKEMCVMTKYQFLKLIGYHDK